MEPLTLIAAVLGAGGLGAVLAFRKTSAEAEAVSVATLRGVIEELRVEVSRLRVENNELRVAFGNIQTENRELRERILRLET